ncbi:hypothetical protein WBG99_13440 [Streptomyces sp. TG1A-60]|uniref:hypothetical protein n=1 Tax=Streptomyces sp. TG1A-60 TaxID=3129111 RepID=UPI0030CC239C
MHDAVGERVRDETGDPVGHLAPGCLGAISGGVRLVFPDTPDGTPSDASDSGSGSRV